MRFIVKTLFLTLIMVIPMILFPLFPMNQTSSVEELNIESLPEENIKPLSQQLVELNGRGAGTKWEEKAADILADNFREIGLKAFSNYPDYLQKFEIGDVKTFREDGRIRFKTVGSNRNDSQNVLGYLPGHSPEGKWIILSAHYDGQGEINEVIYPSANDNLSGILALIALAKSLAGTTETNCNLLFAAFGSEEVGLLGSNFLATNLPIPKENIQAVINLDTIGKNCDKIHLYAGQSNPLIPLFSPILFSYGYETEAIITAGISDHYPFYFLGIPSITISTANWKEGNHEPDDIMENLDFKQIGSIAGAVKQSIRYIAP